MMKLCADQTRFRRVCVCVFNVRVCFFSATLMVYRCASGESMLIDRVAHGKSITFLLSLIRKLFPEPFV